MPPKAVKQPWAETREPWTRLHIDFAGPTQGYLFLIVGDSFSKWLEVRVVPSTSSQSAISVLRELFATHGIPLVIVSDNATAFISTEFQIFLMNNLIRHARIAPYYPASNGQAERMVQTTKHFLKMTKLARFLVQQHSTADILINRKLQTRLSSLHPRFLETSNKQTLEKDTPEVLRKFRAKDPVFARNYGNRPKWSPAFIQKPLGPVSYRLDTPEGKSVLHRYVDQIRRRQEEIDSSTILPDTCSSPRLSIGTQLHVDGNEVQRDANIQVDVAEPIPGGQVGQNKPVRPTRPRNPPRYLNNYTS
ncbi:hypothetical protein JTB14_018330 [Gonioctena quinquepunctata]|nr:hypothetical protein JTB14_018330 [Gonioctena quinquepunctata]